MMDGRVGLVPLNSNRTRISGPLRVLPYCWTARIQSSAFLPTRNWSNTSREAWVAHTWNLPPPYLTSHLALRAVVFMTADSTSAALTPGLGLGKWPEG
jgi:hypothetical protein